MRYYGGNPTEMADKWCSTYSYISTLDRLSELGTLAELKLPSGAGPLPAYNTHCYLHTCLLYTQQINLH